MYTQCSHCRAVFRVTMKELTAAQGLLRCGECDTIFDAMKALSTTLPDERSAAPATMASESSALDKRIKLLPQNETGRRLSGDTGIDSARSTAKKAPRSRKFLYMSLIALGLLLLLQLAYTARGWFMQSPATSSLTQSLCSVIGCTVEIPRDVEHIQMLSHNVYTHPNSPNVLIISTSIQNNADFSQPYPLLEISFTNPAAEIVALRRFTPAEYLGAEKADELMPKGVPREFTVNIADPGKDAVRFQFRFL